MNNVSWRHHYLPEFYLKRFTNSNNKFFIYNVKSRSFINKGKEYTPRSYFFERDANTIFLDKKKDDFLEVEFANLDNKTADLFNIIDKNSDLNRFGMDEENMPQLLLFIYSIYWRIPFNQPKLENYIKGNGLNGLGLSFKVNKTINIEAKEKGITENENFIKFSKMSKSIYDLASTTDFSKSFRIIPFMKGLPHICCDNPIILKDKNSLFNDELIFPLSGDLIFLRTNSTNSFNLHFKLLIDTMLIKQADKYVCVSDIRYIEELTNFFEKNFKSVEELRNKIFEFLDN